MPLGERDALGNLVPVGSLGTGHAGGVAYGSKGSVGCSLVLLIVEVAFLYLLAATQETEKASIDRLHLVGLLDSLLREILEVPRLIGDSSCLPQTFS